MKDFFDRLDMFMKISDLNDNKITVQAGLSVGAIGKQRKGSRGLSNDSIAKILYTYPDLNADWLLTGRGEMLISKDNIKFQNDNYRLSPDVEKFECKGEKELETQYLPLYDIEATAGLVGVFEHHNNPIDKISIPHLPKCDGAVYVRGDSMYPILKSGDIICYKQIMCLDYIIYGEMYIISFNMNDEEYITVKYINKSDDDKCIKLVSQNTHHAPQDIPKSTIRAIAMVKASIRFNTMG